MNSYFDQLRTIDATTASLLKATQAITDGKVELVNVDSRTITDLVNFFKMH